MSKNQMINIQKNSLNNCKLEEPKNILINKQPENFFEDEEIFFNVQNNNENNNFENSLNLPNNKKSHSSSIKTNATFGEISLKANEEFSFFSLNNHQNNNLNIIEKKKELTKDSIEILNNFISRENSIISNINNINDELDNVSNNINIKDIKNNLFSLEQKIIIYFKKPYMRKNIKNNKKIINNLFDEDKVEDEKIKFNEKNFKMEDLKDDESKTNNDSIEESNIFDKKKYQ